MNIEQKILKVLKEENPNTIFLGLRGLVRTNENIWSFRYTFQDGDYLSISDEIKVQIQGLNNVTFLTKSKSKKKKNTKKPATTK
jgi:D-hexose-6-phosphate mutarotase